jgi:hypothetical protein
VTDTVVIHHSFEFGDRIVGPDEIRERSHDRADNRNFFSLFHGILPLLRWLWLREFAVIDRDTVRADIDWPIRSAIIQR